MDLVDVTGFDVRSWIKVRTRPLAKAVIRIIVIPIENGMAISGTAIRKSQLKEKNIRKDRKAQNVNFCRLFIH